MINILLFCFFGWKIILSFLLKSKTQRKISYLIFLVLLRIFWIIKFYFGAWGNYFWLNITVLSFFSSIYFIYFFKVSDWSIYFQSFYKKFIFFIFVFLFLNFLLIYLRLFLSFKISCRESFNNLWYLIS